MNPFTGPAGLREAIRKMERKLGILEDIQVSCCGVTFAQCHAIVEIGRSGSLSLNDLAEILGLDKSTMSRTLNNLVNNQLAERDLDPDDRRYITIKLTEQGQRTFREIEDAMNTYFTQVYNSIPEAKRAQVIESMEIVLEALSEADCQNQCQMSKDRNQEPEARKEPE